MLGQELVRVFSLDGQYEVAGGDREDIYPAPIVPASGESSSQDSIKKPIKYNRCRVDVTDFVAAEQKIREYEPEIILNAVAYNEVDKCEESGEEYKKALLLSGEVPKFLARENQYISKGCSSCGQTSAQAPQRMHGISGALGGKTRSEWAIRQLVALITGTCSLGKIAVTGQTDWQAPQSMQVLGSM